MTTNSGGRYQINVPHFTETARRVAPDPAQFLSWVRTMTDLPSLAITVGDVAGVGPELALRAIANPVLRARCVPKLIGPLAAIERISRKLGIPVLADTIDVGSLDASVLMAGKFTADTGQASFDAVCRAIDMAISGDVAGIVTGPIQKEAWKLAGVPYAGHTELLADRTSALNVRMMLTSESISCVLVTIHVPLADVPDLLTTASIEDSIRLAAETMTARLGKVPRVTVCGLNPHAGEHGMFSHGEEETIIQPAIDRCRHDGLNVTGALPPDTAFTPKVRANTDVYVCMYHDQGLIPLKALSFDDAVNVTLGLPIVRTSVDHGTALDLAWTGQASDTSFRAAIAMAIDLARSEARTDESAT